MKTRRQRRCPVTEAVAEFVRQLPSGAGGGVVAVSGGPDSVALLRALAADRKRPLVVAHVNHGLRGAASRGDEQFVRELAASLGPNVVYRSTSVDLSHIPAGGNLEATARHFRYSWLTELAKEWGARWIATGHTLDDQAETVLHRVLRGTGLPGLAGIAARRAVADSLDVVRPLLSVRREDVLAYLFELNQPARTDESNADTKFTRNRIRHDLLPLLAAKYNPRVVETLAHLGQQAQDAQEIIEAQAARLLRKAERPAAGRLRVFERRTLGKAGIPLRRAMFHRLWQREGWPRLEMGFREWDALAKLCDRGPVALDLPGGIVARRKDLVVQMGPKP